MRKKKYNTQLKKLPKLKAKKQKAESKTKAEEAGDEITHIPPELTPTLKKLAAKDKVHYVNGREFEEEIRCYYKSGNITEKLGESLTKIANGLSYAPNFINYSYKDDMIGDAIVKMFSALRNQKFRLDSGFSPFSYFTTIAFHAFINRIKKENKHHAALNEYREKVYTEHMINPELMGGAHIYVEPDKVDPDNYNSANE
jgi:hypothetical protein